MHRLIVQKDPVSDQKLEGGDVLYFPLENDLPEGSALALYQPLGTLSYLALAENQQPRILVQQQFTSSELSLLRPLLEQYPHYSPHEMLFASFYNGAITEKTLARARERLREAADAGLWDHEMRPVRNVLSRVRLKIKDFGLDILSILETGYILMITKRTGRQPDLARPR
jgi:hypothetical protein